MNGITGEDCERIKASLAANGYVMHKHNKLCQRHVEHVLAKDEEILFELRQSYLQSISPDRIIATNKRLIIVRPSFWGLYMGHDVLNPSELSFVPYRNVISIMMNRGKILASLHIRIHGFTDSSPEMGKEGNVEGVVIDMAVKFTRFIEEIVELMNENGEAKETAEYTYANSGNKEEHEGLSLDEAKEMVSKGDARFAWTGVEPIGEVAMLLGIKEDEIVKIDLNSIEEKEIKEINKYIFIFYTWSMGSHIAKFLKEKHGVELHMLKHGIAEYARRKFKAFN